MAARRWYELSLGRWARWEPASMAPVWTVAALLAAYQLLIGLVGARATPVGPFDDGIEFTSVTYVLHGQIPIADFYEPYGLGLPLPGVLFHLLGLRTGFDLRLAYVFFSPLVTLFAVPFVWRRAGWVWALLVGCMCVASGTPRYSMCFAAILGFALMIDRHSRKSGGRPLSEIADRSPRAVLAASAVLSLAGWARVEYAVLPVVWALILAVVLRGRIRWLLASATVALAALPTLIVTVAGGARHVLWILEYNLDQGRSGFHAQRGLPVDWSAGPDRLKELAHLQLGISGPSIEVATYGVGLAVVIAAAVILILPRTRDRLLRADATYLTPFFVLVCAFVLYAQSARFSTGYGLIGAPMFWIAAALLWNRIGLAAAAVVAVVLAYPAVASVAAPALILNNWNARPPLGSMHAPGLGGIPLGGNAPTNLSELAVLWRQLGFQGRSTISIGQRNDVAWGNDAIVGYVLDAPAAAWPLTYDPGLVNRQVVEQETVRDLCHDRAPLVQAQSVYPYPPNVPLLIGSRTLDEFLAVDYRVRAVAGLQSVDDGYQILVPDGPGCITPAKLGVSALQRIRDRLITQGELPEAGAVGIALTDRAHQAGIPVDPTDAAVAALGGYQVGTQGLPPALRPVVSALSGHPPPVSYAYLAAAPWPSDIEKLAAQTAWLAHRRSGEPGAGAAAGAILALALHHANWPAAIANMTNVVPPSPSLIRRLAATGGAGIPEFDSWRHQAYVNMHLIDPAIRAGVALALDYERIDDPLDLEHAELALIDSSGISSACREMLGVRAAAISQTEPEPAGTFGCRQPALGPLLR